MTWWTIPVPGGPAFLLGQNFAAVKSYDPAFSYALAVCHLADRIRGGGPIQGTWPALVSREIHDRMRALTGSEDDDVERRGHVSMSIRNGR